MNDSELVRQLVKITGVSREDLIAEVARLKQNDGALQNLSRMADILLPNE